MSVDLVRLAQQGDRRAFENLVAGRIDRMYASAALILHDRHWGEDATQEALVRAWRSLPKLRDPDRFDGWLRQVLVHACIDTARRTKHHRSDHELPMELAADEQLESAVADRDALGRAFATLSIDHRAVFVLRHYFGHSVPELADALKIRLGTAKSRLHYAEKAMAAAMNAEQQPLAEGGVG
jgi:RNA polymerase sigma-70 factor (ECF subfamily)